MSSYVTKRAFELKLPIEDAKESLVLEVQPEDVSRAQQKNSRCCALVRAAERQMADVRAAFFFRTTAYLEYDDKIVRFNLPPSVQKEIVAFDRTRHMEPGVYQLTRPTPTQTLSATKKRSKKNETRKRHDEPFTLIKRAVIRHRTSGIRTGSDPSYRAEK